MRRAFAWVVGLGVAVACRHPPSVEPLLAEDPGKLVVRIPRATSERRVFRDPDVEAHLKRLRALPIINGVKISFAGADSKARAATAVLLARLTDDDVEWLLEDDDPLVRTFGFDALAMRGRSEELLAHVCDREGVVMRRCDPDFGCYYSSDRVGTIARDLYVDPTSSGVIAGDAGTSPSASAVASLDLRILATDACVAWLWWNHFDRTTYPLGWKQLQRLAPTVPTWVLAKALGREPTPRFQLLAQILGDASEAPGARVAAASALTRSSSHDAEVAIEENRGFLDGITPGLAAQLRQTITRRRRFESAWAPVASMEPEKAADVAIVAYAVGGIAALTDPPYNPDHGVRADEVRAARARALIGIAERLDEHMACWDTYRNTAYVLTRKLASVSGLEGFSTVEADRYQALVRTGVDRLDAEPICP